jgi:hypothetical protein
MTGAGMTGVLAKVRSAGKARAYQAPLACSHRSAPAQHTLNPPTSCPPGRPSRGTALARAPLTMPRTSTTPSLTTRPPRTSRPAGTTPPTLTDRRAGTTRRSTTTRRMTTARPRHSIPRTLRRPPMRQRRPMPGHGLRGCPTSGPIRPGRPGRPICPGGPIWPGHRSCPGGPIWPGHRSCPGGPIWPGHRSCPGGPICPGRRRRLILRLSRTRTPRPVLRSLRFRPLLIRASTGESTAPRNRPPNRARGGP